MTITKLSRITASRAGWRNFGSEIATSISQSLKAKIAPHEAKNAKISPSWLSQAETGTIQTANRQKMKDFLKKMINFEKSACKSYYGAYNQKCTNSSFLLKYLGFGETVNFL